MAGANSANFEFCTSEPDARKNVTPHGTRDGSFPGWF